MSLVCWLCGELLSNEQMEVSGDTAHARCIRMLRMRGGEAATAEGSVARSDDETTEQTAIHSELCFVRWIDARSVDAWTEPGECEVAPATVESVGWVYGETEDALTIAGSKSDCGQMSGMMIIPKVCVQERIELVVPTAEQEADSLSSPPPPDRSCAKCGCQTSRNVRVARKCKPPRERSSKVCDLFAALVKLRSAKRTEATEDQTVAVAEELRELGWVIGTCPRKGERSESVEPQSLREPPGQRKRDCQMHVPRRQVGVIITGKSVALLARAGKREIDVSSPVPETASFFTSYFDHSRNAYVAVFEDESFDPVGDGALVPILSDPCSMTESPITPKSLAEMAAEAESDPCFDDLSLDELRSMLQTFGDVHGSENRGTQFVSQALARREASERARRAPDPAEVPREDQ